MGLPEEYGHSVWSAVSDCTRTMCARPGGQVKASSLKVPFSALPETQKHTEGLGEASFSLSLSTKTHIVAWVGMMLA